jgi:hypothetical protein
MKVSSAKKYKDSLYAALSRDLGDFEKNFLLIAAGVLTFSITFIKDIVNVTEAEGLFFLFLGWFGFTLAVALLMVTFLRSAYASDEISLKVETKLQEFGKTEDEDELDASQTSDIKTEARQILLKSKTQLKALRYAAIAAFLIGFLSFGGFVAFNLSQEAAKVKSPAPGTIELSKDGKSATVGGWKLTWKDSTMTIGKEKK